MTVAEMENFIWQKSMSEVHFAIYFQESTFISRNVLGTSFLISRIAIKALNSHATKECIDFAILTGDRAMPEL